MPSCLFLFSLYVPGEVAYDVAWFQSPALAMENGPVPLVSMDHWGVVKKSGGNESSRYTIERTDRDTFVLSVYHIKDRDVGEYYCTAKLWHFSPDTQRWSEGPARSALPVFLSINLACKYHAVSFICNIHKHNCKSVNFTFFCVSSVWDSMRNPVLYGLGAALFVGLLSIVLGLITSRCCFSRNPMHTPRSKLMDLEMDWATWPKVTVFLLLMWPHFNLNPLQDSMAANVFRKCIEPRVFRYVWVHCFNWERRIFITCGHLGWM